MCRAGVRKHTTAEVRVLSSVSRVSMLTLQGNISSASIILFNAIVVMKSFLEAIELNLLWLLKFIDSL
jgi:hypothetical protein